MFFNCCRDEGSGYLLWKPLEILSASLSNYSLIIIGCDDQTTVERFLQTLKCVILVMYNFGTNCFLDLVFLSYQWKLDDRAIWAYRKTKVYDSLRVYLCHSVIKTYGTKHTNLLYRPGFLTDQGSWVPSTLPCDGFRRCSVLQGIYVALVIILLPSFSSWICIAREL